MMHSTKATLTKHVLLICLMLMLLCIQSVRAQEPSNTRFGAPIILLRFTEEGGHQLITPHLSPHGSFIVAQVETYSRKSTEALWFEGASQYLWDLREVTSDTQVEHLEPIQHILIDDSSDGPAFAFHPNEQILAVATNTEVQLRSLPELELVVSISVVDNTVEERYASTTISERLSWSPDGVFLAILAGEEIIVWDIETETITRRTLGNVYQEVLRTDSGWFIPTHDAVETNTFTFCDWQLEMCVSYDVENLCCSPQVSRDGQRVLTELGRWEDGQRVFGDPFVNPTLQAWHRQQDSTYLAGEPFVVEPPFWHPSFSPNSQYLIARNGVDWGWTIWNTATWEQTSHLDDSGSSTWLPNNENIVTWQAAIGLSHETLLKLYQVGNSAPINVLNLDIIPELEGIEGWGWDVWALILETNQDGRQVLANLGWASLVVPIVYE